MLDIPKDKIEDIKEILKNGERSEFWIIMCQAIDDTIEILREQEESDDFKDLPAERYKLEMELLKTKIKYLKHLKESPTSIAQHITEPRANIEAQENPDPFFSPEEIEIKEKEELKK